ncbi:flagellar basal-body MS-ring/collar protein FliF [Alicyclobacillus hesperidum]|nr:flagellar basal-body MS-ring/collar protein FliF [Alicyclobacillus hesperidum]
MNETLRGMWTNLKGRWMGLSPFARRNAIIAFVAALAALATIVFVVSRPHYVTIMEGLDDKSLGQVQQELDTLKIPNQIQGTAVLVPAREADEARIQLSMAGLPQSGYVGYSSVSTSFGLTQDQFNIQVLDALQQSLNATIASINGVESAQVHIVMPEQQLFVTQPTSDAKASVFVTLGTGVQLSPAQVAGIQELVAHSVQGLSVGNVTVVDQYGDTLSSDTPSTGSTVTGSASSELAMREKLENDLQQKLVSGLQQIVGAQNAVVVVHANVTFNQTETTSHVLYNAPGSTNGFVTSTQVDKSQTTNGTGTGGAVGQAGSNPNLNSTYAAGGSAGSNSTSSDTTTNYAFSYQNQQTTSDPMQVQGYSVGVLLNSNDQSITPAVQAQIKNFVAGVLGGTQTQGKNQVSVSAVPFTSMQQPTTMVAPSSHRFIYALGALLLLAIGGGMVWYRRRRMQAKELQIPTVVSDVFEHELEELPLTEEEVLRSQLVNLAKQRPDDFTSLLRSWLSE